MNDTHLSIRPSTHHVPSPWSLRATRTSAALRGMERRLKRCIMYRALEDCRIRGPRRGLSGQRNHHARGPNDTEKRWRYFRFPCASICHMLLVHFKGVTGGLVYPARTNLLRSRRHQRGAGFQSCLLPSATKPVSPCVYCALEQAYFFFANIAVSVYYASRGAPTCMEYRTPAKRTSTTAVRKKVT